MNADEIMDARLREAGERWRADEKATTSAPITIDTVHDLTEHAPKKRNRWTYLISAAAVALVGAGAATFVVTRGDSDNGVTSTAQPGFLGTTWVLVGITDTSGASVPVAAKATLFVGSDGTVAGKDGCNEISGLVKVTARNIQVIAPGLASTDMGCVDAGVGKEVAVVNGVLDNVPGGAPLTYTVAGGRLTLTRTGKGRLVYKRESLTITSNPRDIVGTWALNSVGTESSASNGSASGTSTGSSDYAQIRVTFDGHGHITIAHACYLNAGAADVGAGTIDISDVTLRQAIPCPSTTAGDAQSLDSTVDAFFGGHLTWRVESNQLAMSKRLSNGSLQDLDFDRQH